jgi:hypothetical protein
MIPVSLGLLREGRVGEERWDYTRSREGDIWENVMGWADEKEQGVKRR